MGSSRQAWAGAALGFAAVVLFAFRDGGTAIRSRGEPRPGRRCLRLRGSRGRAAPAGRPSRLTVLMLLGLAAFAAGSRCRRSGPSIRMRRSSRRSARSSTWPSSRPRSPSRGVVARRDGGRHRVRLCLCGRRPDRAGRPSSTRSRARSCTDLGYANALAGLAAIGLAVAVVLALRPRWRLPAVAAPPSSSPRSPSPAVAAAGSPRSPAPQSGSRSRSAADGWPRRPAWPRRSVPRPRPSRGLARGRGGKRVGDRA